MTWKFSPVLLAFEYVCIICSLMLVAGLCYALHELIPKQWVYYLGALVALIVVIMTIFKHTPKIVLEGRVLSYYPHAISCKNQIELEPGMSIRVMREYRGWVKSQSIELEGVTLELDLLSNRAFDELVEALYDIVGVPVFKLRVEE